MTNPDRWVILKVTKNDTNEFWYMILAGWSGGYLDGDSWRMSSAIHKVEDKDDHFIATTYSGREYKLFKQAKGFNYIMSGVFNEAKKGADESNKTIEIIDTENLVDLF